MDYIDILPVLFVLFFVSIASIGAGSLFLKIFTFFRNQEESLIIYYFIGQSILASFFLFIAILLSGLALLIVVLLTTSLSFYYGFCLIRKKKLVFKMKPSFLFILLIITLGFHFLFAAHIPTEWDEVAYHFPVLKELSQGNIHFPLLSQSAYLDFYQPFSIFYGSLPYHSESYASIVYLLSGKLPIAAHLTYFLNFVIFLLFLSSFFKKMYGDNKRTIYTILLLITTNYGFMILLGTGLVDINTTIYQFISLALLIYAHRDKRKELLILSAFFMGTALGHKFTTIFLLPAYILYFLYIIYNTKQKLSILVFSVTFAFIGGSVWYLKNILLYFNPVYPLYFGHQGLTNSQYDFLYDSLITGIRTAVGMKGILKIIAAQYLNETSTVLSVIYVFITITCYKKIKSFEIFLLVSAVSFYFINFQFGSQLSRYVLLTPLIFHILSFKLLKKSTLLTFSTLAIVLIALEYNTLQESVWKSRFNAITLRKEESSSDCMKKFLDMQSQNNNSLQPGSILNLWDAYLAVSYQNSDLIYNFHGKNNLDNFQLPSSIKYIYVNPPLEELLLSASNLHRDMEPEKRAQIEKELIGKSNMIFTSGDCSFYQI